MNDFTDATTRDADEQPDRVVASCRHESTGTTRRRVLSGAAGAVVGVGALAGATSAQESKVTTTMAVPASSEFEGNYVGQFLVLTSGGRTPSSTPGLDDCSATSWTPSESRAYDGLLVDRLAQDPRGVERTVYVAAEDREVAAGSTFVVSDATDCRDFVALGVEQVGPLSVPEGTETAADDGDENGAVPGFTGVGVVAAVAALLGISALRSRDED